MAAAREQADALFGRTRDLRVAMLWMRAGVHLDCFAAAPQGLRLMQGLLDSFWDTLHPRPDPDDGPRQRAGVLPTNTTASSATCG